MEPSTSVTVHDRFASDYDRQVQKYNCFAADVLFGLCFEYVRPGQRLLDIGTGTGLSALPFAKAGLQVFGMDGSLEMLKICDSKNAGIVLQQFDLRNTPWPYADAFVDHVVACGVFHFFRDLEGFFAEAARVIRENGVFAFTFKATREHDAAVESTAGDVPVFAHGRAYIDACLANHGFREAKSVPFYVGNPSTDLGDLFYGSIVQRLA